MLLGPSNSRSDTDVVFVRWLCAVGVIGGYKGTCTPSRIHFYHPQRSCGKVKFLHLSVILFTGGCLPQCMLGYTQPPDTPLLGRHPLADTPQTDTSPGQTPAWADTHPQQMATAVDSTHPAGMHSCLSFSCSFWQKPCQTRMHSSRMHTAHCNCHFSCHTHPQPTCMPSTTHAPLPCMPPCHTCPPTMHAPPRMSPLPHMPPHHACPSPTMHTPHGQNS